MWWLMHFQGDGKRKAEMVKQMHQKAKQQMEKVNERRAAQANKRRKKMVFQPGDLVWVHLRKERFPTQRKSKLQPRSDGPFEVLERINDNAYKINLPGEYGVSVTFNVTDLAPFYADDDNSRTNSFEEGEDDEEPVAPIPHQGPITRVMAKKLQGLVHKHITKSNLLQVFGLDLEEGSQPCCTFLCIFEEPRDQVASVQVGIHVAATSASPS
ncbi:uncharacterized protein LOC131174514 [Hevea brasiliensis]|uniref:uncharacterized protein LOC131174514 n=1 Tax=Hevea brasiliensis TaxID=3981 RepID=UPI0025E2277E|nr:uncharacterized protein LOC131174514 [Hevea brasiliensis]